MYHIAESQSSSRVGEKVFDKKSYNSQYYQSHKAKRAEDARRWRQNNPDKVREANHKQYLKRKAEKANEL